MKYPNETIKLPVLNHSNELFKIASSALINKSNELNSVIPIIGKSIK
jgi:hypothetical protein